MKIQPYEVKVPQATLDDLRARLDRTRWTDEIAGANWDYGTDLEYLRKLCDYWRRDFDWRRQEKSLNDFANFQTEIDGSKIHFIHERGRGANPIPLVLTHGFPDSFYRFYKLIPLLTEEKDDFSFDVVVPDMPGFGFSQKPTRPGIRRRVPALWHKLMTEKLGYGKFAAAGGDIGGGITQQLGREFPDAIIGLHLTEVPSQNAYFFDKKDKSDLSEAEKKYFAAGEKWTIEEGAYAHLQSTKPQTAAYALNDSPAGLAAWIVEKFRTWSDCGGNVESRFTKDELLTNITIYWATETINSSFNYYYERTHGQPPANLGKRVDAPCGFAMFPKDITPAPREFAERFFNVARWTEAERGGHFAALEEPELLANEMRAFFKELRITDDKLL